ncbi:transposase [bacterium]|nr:transposase [bacterium]
MRDIGAITQHIPEKGFQLVRYYGWYSNKSRGIRARQQKQEVAPGLQKTEIGIIDISSYQAPKVSSKKWRS